MHDLTSHVAPPLRQCPSLVATERAKIWHRQVNARPGIVGTPGPDNGLKGRLVAASCLLADMSTPSPLRLCRQVAHGMGHDCC